MPAEDGLKYLPILPVLSSGKVSLFVSAITPDATEILPASFWVNRKIQVGLGDAWVVYRTEPAPLIRPVYIDRDELLKTFGRPGNTDEKSIAPATETDVLAVAKLQPASKETIREELRTIYKTIVPPPNINDAVPLLQARLRVMGRHASRLAAREILREDEFAGKRRPHGKPPTVKLPKI